MEGIFFGSKKDRAEYYKQKGIEVSEPTPDEDKKSKESKVSNKLVLDATKVGPMTDEERRILTRARHYHDPLKVYMQSDISFYDRFYMEETTSEIVKDAHRLRRIYKNYRDYIQALMIRDAYLEWVLDEKFGGNLELYRIDLQSNSPTFWVPPRPILSVRSIDGPIDTHQIFNMQELCDEPTDEDFQKMFDYLGKDLDDLYLGDGPGDGIISDVLTNLAVIEYCDKQFEDDNPRSSPAKRVQSTEAELRSIIQSWYRDEATDTKAPDETRAFCKTPERIREEFYRYLGRVEMTDDIHEAVTDPYYDEKDHTNWDEMVFDEVSNRPMTRREQYRRMMIRQLGQCGWNELHLMEIMGVGTRNERKSLEKKELRKRKIRNKLKPETEQLRLERMQGSNDYDDSGSAPNILDELDEMLGGYGGWN